MNIFRKLINLYRGFFTKYFLWADILFIGYLNRLLEQKLSRNANLYYDKAPTIPLLKKKEKIKKEEKVILMDGLHHYTGILFQNTLFSKLLSFKYNVKTIAYSPLPEPKLNKVYQKFGIDHFVSIYSFFNIKILYLSFYNAFKAIKNANRLTNYENLNVIIDGVDIGEHIYDQFLRKELHGTYRKLSLIYFLYVFRGCYYYLRFKDILIKNSVTDIILSHRVYMPAILIKAASVVNGEINIWLPNDRYTEFCVSFSKAFENQKEIVDTRQYKPLYKELLMNRYSKEDIEEVYSKISLDTIEAVSNNVYNNLDNFNYDRTKKNIFVFPHAFNDAVRHANNPIYCDYYIWFKETLKLLNKNENINVFVKPHPSEYKFKYKESSRATIDEILAQSDNKNIFFIDKNINRDFLYDFTDAIVTVCGSIGLEAPCQGLPVVTAARGTYYEAHTTLNSENYEEYKAKIDNIHNIKRLSDEKIFDAKIVFIFAMLLRKVKTDLSIKYHLMNEKKHGLETDVQIFKDIENWFNNIGDLKKTEMYKSLEVLIDNDYYELISFEKFEEVLNKDV